MSQTEIALNKQELIDLICANAYATYRACVVGGACDNVQWMHVQMTGQPLYGDVYAPLIQRDPMKKITHRREGIFYFNQGDLVMEISTIYDKRHNGIRIGYVISDKQEHAYEDDVRERIKDQYEGDPRPMEQVTRIKALLDGKEQKWTNASFIRIYGSANELP